MASLIYGTGIVGAKTFYYERHAVQRGFTESERPQRETETDRQAYRSRGRPRVVVGVSRPPLHARDDLQDSHLVRVSFRVG